MCAVCAPALCPQGVARALSRCGCAGGEEDGDAWGAHTSAAGRYSSGEGDDEDEDGSPGEHFDGEEFEEGQVRCMA